MPEWAELRITSDFVNSVSDKTFNRAEKSPVSKVDTDLSFMQSGETFTIEAEARGKELRLKIGETSEGGELRYLLMFMGMSGGFALIRPTYKDFDKVMKHSHLRFFRSDGAILCFHDVRRFGKWKWTKEWSKNRGYDPVTEFYDWIKDVSKNYHNIKGYVSEELMNQRWFNGVGNYLRAEILWRANINPWKKFCELEHEELAYLLNVIYECMITAYKNQGGTIKDWMNPFDVSEGNQSSMSNWIIVYNQHGSSMIKDKTGRTFWFNPKWNDQVPEKYLKKKHKLVTSYPF